MSQKTLFQRAMSYLGTTLRILCIAPALWLTVGCSSPAPEPTDEDREELRQEHIDTMRDERNN